MLRFVLWTITLLRVALLPPFVFLALRAQRLAASGVDVGSESWAVGIMLVVIGLSDVLDGWIARRFDLATQIGAIVDAVADKLVQVTLVTLFTFSSGPAFASIPLWFLVLLVGRDAVLGGGLLFATSRNVRIEVVHEWHGRLSSALVFAILGWITFGLPTAPVLPAIWATGVLIFLSSASYLWTGIRQATVILRERREGRGESL